MTTTETPGTTHDALFFTSHDEMLGGAAPFLRDGLEAGEHVVLICDEDTGAALAGALDDDTRITVLPREQVYQRAPEAIATYREFVAEQKGNGVRRVRVAGEIGFTGQEADWTEFVRFEAGLNDGFEASLSNLCMYDRRALDRDTLVAAAVTHRYLRTNGERIENSRYVDPADVLRRVSAPAPDPVGAGGSTLVVDALDRLSELRRLVREIVGHAAPEAAPDDVDNLVIALNEVAGNALQHGTGNVRVRLWVTRERAVCTVSDAGDGFLDPFVGILPEPPDDVFDDGMGLWLVRQLSDEFTAYRTRDGFTVRLAVRFH